jgi:hypothetical protein
MGDGIFHEGDISDQLMLRVTSSSHGLVEPKFEMPLSEYERALQSTRQFWKMDEA